MKLFVVVAVSLFSLNSFGSQFGRVKWFNSIKGYGYISPSGGGKDVFVHLRALERGGLWDLKDNACVSYEVAFLRDGRTSATDIELIRCEDLIEKSQARLGENFGDDIDLQRDNLSTEQSGRGSNELIEPRNNNYHRLQQEKVTTHSK